MTQSKAKLIDAIRALKGNNSVSKERIKSLAEAVRKLLHIREEKEKQVATIVRAFEVTATATAKNIKATQEVVEEVQSLTDVEREGITEARERGVFASEQREKIADRVVGAVEESSKAVIAESQKSSEEDKVFFFELLKQGIKAIGLLFSRIVVKVQPTAEHYQIPQKVVIYDPYTKKTLSAKDFHGSAPSGAQAFSTVVVDTASMVSALEAGLAQYRVSDVDDASSVKYYGFVRANGYWYILKEDTSVAPKTYRYVQGLSNYTSQWTDRASLTYGYFNDIF